MKDIVIRKILSCFIALSVFWTSVDSGRAAELALGPTQSPGMVRLSPTFQPPVLKGVKVYADEPFRFDFIMDKGNAEGKQLEARGLKQEEGSTDQAFGTSSLQPLASSQSGIKSVANKLIRYFLASLTVPEKDLWVNLSPYEKDRIITDEFGQTQMGRDLLAQDYLLKQLTASVIYPESDSGKKFWKEVYKRAYEKYGTTDIPVDTFNKVWIVPEKAVVYEKGETLDVRSKTSNVQHPTSNQYAVAYVVDAKLKVMLESDYLAASKDTRHSTLEEQPTIAGPLRRSFRERA